MNMNFGLIISGNNDSAFKSKISKESHNILGQTVQQWSAMALREAAFVVESISSHEVGKCKELIEKADQVLISWADQPLVLKDTVHGLLNRHQTERNDATAIFSSSSSAAIYVFDGRIFSQRLDELNVQTLSRDAIHKVFQSITVKKRSISQDEIQFLVIRDRIDLSKAISEIKMRILREIMLGGVTILDPQSTYIDVGADIGEDTVIMPNTMIQGSTVIGENCMIGPGSRISDCKIGNNVEIANSVAVDSQIGEGTHVGPFAYLRPGSIIGRNVKIGDFVEVKKSVIGDRTKISHLTYVGDAEVGTNVNIGCGVVFVNYDGRHKNKTIVGDNAFVGCNVNLISPVVVKDNAYVAAGSTITDEVPENSLAIARERQIVKQDWVIKKDLKRE